MLGPYGETLVVDWGLAKLLDAAESAPAAIGGGEAPLRPSSASSGPETVAGQAVGTPQYMSPEQAAGRVDLLGPASDVYCLGATLYSLLTGQAPFKRGHLAEILRCVERGDFPPPRQVKPTVPLPLQAICLKAMATRPERRYARPQQLAEDVERWLADEPVSAWPEPVLVRAGRWVRRHKPLVSGAAAALMVSLVALVAGALWYQHDQARQAQEQLARDNEAERQRLLTEQEIAQALEQGRKLRGDLHKELQLRGGAQTLLNQPERWKALLQGIDAELARARSLATRAGHAVAADLTKQVRQLGLELDRDTADYRLALRLEHIRLDTATLVEGKFALARAEQEYPEAFAEAGLAPLRGRLQIVAALIRQSAIQELLVAALDDWAWISHVQANPALTIRLLEVARLADPDPWRDRVRDLALWKNNTAMVRLVEEVQANQPFLARLSPQMLDLVAMLLPQENREPWLRQAQAAHPRDFWLNFHLTPTLLDNNEPQEAAGFCRVALALRPNTAAVYNNLGLALREQKKLPEALDAYHKALTLDRKVAKTWNNLGVALHDQKDLPGAIDAYREAIACDPKLSMAWNNLGVALREQKKLPAALDALRQALLLSPKDAKVWSNLGLVLHDRKDLLWAIAAHRQALVFDAKFAPAWYNLGSVLRDSEDLPAAINAYQQALALDPKLVQAWVNLGNALQAQAKLPAALDAYHKALALDPKHAMAWYNLGTALDDQKDLPGAIDAYRKAVDFDPRDFKAWTNLGGVLAEHGELPAALDAFRQALALDPTHALAWYGLGSALQDQKDLPGAIDAYHQALAFDPKFVKAWNNLGNALAAQGNLPGAIDAYRKAQAVDPKDAMAWYNLGRTLQDHNDLPGTIDAYRNALARDPKLTDAWINLGNALHDQGDLPGAVDAHRKALALNPPSVKAWNNLGTTLADQQELAAAIDAYHNALTLDPQFSQAWNNLGIAHYLQMELPAAVKAYRQAVVVDPKNAPAWCNFGLALRLQKEWPAAAEAFGKALALDPNHADAHVGLGAVLHDQGDFAGAIAATQRALALLPKGHASRPLAERHLQVFQYLLSLEKRLPLALQGEPLTAAEYLALAELCRRYLKRYSDAAQLYARGFAAEARAAEQPGTALRSSAARAAALAAAGQGTGKLSDQEKARLRQQALDWLHADLARQRQLLEKQPAAAVALQRELQRWQQEADLASLRDEQELARLPRGERAAWRQLWADIEALRREARGRYTEKQSQGTLTAKQRGHAYALVATAGKTYVIDLESGQFDAYLILDDGQGKVLAENNDIGPEDQNARIIFTAPADGKYRIVATSFQQRGVGAYTLTVRILIGKKP
jgi:tetratricopeptide (TPR) repeat protein